MGMPTRGDSMGSVPALGDANHQCVAPARQRDELILDETGEAWLDAVGAETLQPLPNHVLRSHHQWIKLVGDPIRFGHTVNKIAALAIGKGRDFTQELHVPPVSGIREFLLVFELSALWRTRFNQCT